MNNKLEIKERLRHLNPEEKEKLTQYVEAVKEIKKEIKELLSKKDTVDETGGNFNHSSGLHLDV
jgi:glucosamine 6-phosphate synthetase-like amidotransferase/phosphosugar isomerase protein